MGSGRRTGATDLENLAAQISKIATLRAEHTTSVSSQELEVSGTLTAREVMGIAYQLGLNLDELMVNPRGWLKDHNGISQLVFLLVYNHKLKAR